MLRKKLVRKVFLIIVFSCSFFYANAQCDPFFDPFCEDVDVPLDNEVWALLIVATLLGVWFIFKKKLQSSALA